MKRSPGTVKFLSLTSGPQMSYIAESGTSVAPMCWVMAPASLETTEVPLILSRMEVLPWSTWPSTLTIGWRMD